MELFQTTRQKVLQAYQEAQQPFEASTQPYHSVRQLVGTVEADNPTDVGFVTFRANQELRFFSYGLGDRITLGPNQVEVRESETNLAKGGSTNGASDFIIEGLGFHLRGARVQYDDLGAWEPSSDYVQGVAGGTINGYDPGSIVFPPQVQAPYLLEQGIIGGLTGLMSLQCEWDRTKYKKLGLVDLLPQAGAQSIMRGNGLPTSENRFRVPEGLIWRRDGQPAGEFAAIIRLERDLVVPINLVALPDNETTDLPTYVYLEVCMRLFGLHVQLPTDI